MNKKIVILFDLDGTLIDSTDAILASFHYAFAKQNFHFSKTEQDIIQLIGYPLDYMFVKLGVSQKFVSQFVDSYKENYQKISHKQTTLLTNAKESVKIASRFATLGVVTTKTTLYSRLLLEDFGIWNYFNTIIGRQEVINPKPHPEPILKACEALKVTPSKDIFMIGDTKLDLIAANKANISSIGVLCGYGNKQDLSPYTPHIYEDSLGAVKLVKRLYSKG
jgi:phosphoglycolate phosphatase